LSLMISIIPYILNSVLILFTAFFFKKRASVSLEGNKLVSNQRQSLVTFIAYRRPMTERKIVALISLLMVIFVTIAVLIELPWPLLT
jgi:UDP-N-acetylmuramyl pentapeptide phosphotransferase/UDP-N-acetylglucosamine-1-phosphate transferase